MPPTISPPTRSSWWRRWIAVWRVVFDPSTTTMMPSTFGASSSASATTSDGGAVDQHEVGHRSQRRQHLVHRPRGEQLGRVRRDRARRHHLQAVQHRVRDGLARRRGVPQHLGESDLAVEPEEPVQAGLAQVGRDHDHPVAGLRQGRREVRGRRGLAVAFAGAGHEQDLDVLARGDVHQRRASGAIGLGRDRVGRVDRDEARLVAVPPRRHPRHDGQHGGADRGLHALAASEPLVEALAHEREPDAEREPHDRRRARRS